MKFIENKEAVSPVVGVMLMLVVTLIIAGVVSAFGGGLVSTSGATPQASISSSITYDDSLVLQHKGGDTIMSSAIDIKTKIDAGTFADMIKDVPLKNSTLARTGDSLVNATSFQTGDVLSIPYSDLFGLDMYNKPQAQKGDVVTVTILDKNSGKQIASSTVTVN